MTHNLSITHSGVTPEGLGLVVSRLAERLGVERNQVAVIHWAGAPSVLELWSAPMGYRNMTFDDDKKHLGNMVIDFTKDDPYELPPAQEWI